MSTKPIIGINTDLRGAQQGQATYSVLHSGYYDCVLQAGGLPILIPPIVKRPEIVPLLERIDGLILTGGDDLNPRKLGMRPHMSSKIMQPRREEADRIMLDFARQKQIPTVGIGVGMQMINATFGGTLYQHLPEDLPRALPHHDPHGGSHRHAIDVTPGSRMDDIYGGGDIRVNSQHHQAVRKVAPDFCVSAMAPDGVIEAIEVMNPNWFCVGVQWNPQSETGSALDMQLFEALIEASAPVESPQLFAA